MAALALFKGQASCAASDGAWRSTCERRRQTDGVRVRHRSQRVRWTDARARDTRPGANGGDPNHRRLLSSTLSHAASPRRAVRERGNDASMHALNLVVRAQTDPLRDWSVLLLLLRQCPLRVEGLVRRLHSAQGGGRAGRTLRPKRGRGGSALPRVRRRRASAPCSSHSRPKTTRCVNRPADGPGLFRKPRDHHSRISCCPRTMVRDPILPRPGTGPRA